MAKWRQVIFAFSPVFALWAAWLSFTDERYGEMALLLTVAGAAIAALLLDVKRMRAASASRK